MFLFFLSEKKYDEHGKYSSISYVRENQEAITFHINDGSYRSYKKPHEQIIYTYANSDHRLSLWNIFQCQYKNDYHLYLRKKIFEETGPCYEQHLSNCGYKEKPNFRDTIFQPLITKKKWQRNILWGSTHLTVSQ